jgi:hypothetical protein
MVKKQAGLITLIGPLQTAGRLIAVIMIVCR